jgi:GNAT superfamily N-acetyltransferase
MGSNLLKQANLRADEIVHYAYEFAHQYDREYGSAGYGHSVLPKDELRRILTDKAKNSIPNCNDDDAYRVAISAEKILETMGITVKVASDADPQEGELTREAAEKIRTQAWDLRSQAGKIRPGQKRTALVAEADRLNTLADAGEQAYMTRILGRPWDRHASRTAADSEVLTKRDANWKLYVFEPSGKYKGVYFVDSKQAAVQRVAELFGPLSHEEENSLFRVGALDLYDEYEPVAILRLTMLPYPPTATVKPLEPRPRPQLDTYASKTAAGLAFRITDPVAKEYEGRTPDKSFVMFLRDSEVGAIGYHSLSARKAFEIVDSYVLPAYRGQGYGKKLYDAFLHYAKRQGVQYVVSDKALSPGAESVWNFLVEENKATLKNDKYVAKVAVAEEFRQMNDPLSATDQQRDIGERGTGEESPANALATKVDEPDKNYWHPFGLGMGTEPESVRYGSWKNPLFKKAGHWGNRSWDSDAVHDILDRYRPKGDETAGFEEPIPDENLTSLLSNLDDGSGDKSPSAGQDYLGVIVFLLEHGSEVPSEYVSHAIKIADRLERDTDYLMEWQEPEAREAELRRELDILHHKGSQQPKTAFLDSTAETYIEGRDQTALEIIDEYKAHLGQRGYRQKWTLIPAARLKKIWNDYAKLGFVRDEKGIDQIASIVIQNVYKIDVNTTLTGHTSTSPTGFANSLLEERLPDDYFEQDDSFFEDEHGSWRISDYAMQALQQGVGELLESKSAEEKLQIIDHILNIVHQRNDLSRWFVEGGQATLKQLAGTLDKAEKVLESKLTEKGKAISKEPSIKAAHDEGEEKGEGNTPDTGQYDEEHEAHVREEVKQWAQYAEASDNTDEIKPYDPSGNYFCGTCDMRRGFDECLRVEGKISFAAGGCRLYHMGDPEIQAPMKEKLSKEDAGYEERPEGFGCKRCEYGAKAKSADGQGRPGWCSFWGMHVTPNACCAENEKDGDSNLQWMDDSLPEGVLPRAAALHAKRNDLVQITAGWKNSLLTKKAAYFQFPSWEEYVQEYGVPEDYEAREYSYEDWVSRLNSLEFPLTVYRAVELPPGDRLDLDDAGIYWSTDADSADAYFGGSSLWGPGGGHGKLVMVQAQIMGPKDVNWGETLIANMANPDENEIQVVPGSELKLIGIDRGAGYKPTRRKSIVAKIGGLRGDEAVNFYEPTQVLPPRYDQRHHIDENEVDNPVVDDRQEDKKKMEGPTPATGHVPLRQELAQRRLSAKETVEQRLITALVKYLDKLDAITVEEFARGGEKPEREALVSVLGEVYVTELSPRMRTIVNMTNNLLRMLSAHTTEDFVNGISDELRAELLSEIDKLSPQEFGRLFASDPDAYWLNIVQEQEGIAKKHFMSSPDAQQIAQDNGWTMDQAWEEMGADYANALFDPRNRIVAKVGTMHANRPNAEAYNELESIRANLNYLITGEHFRNFSAELQTKLQSIHEELETAIQGWDTVAGEPPQPSSYEEPKREGQQLPN